jgi:hypothetical protein
VDHRMTSDTEGSRDTAPPGLEVRFEEAELHEADPEVSTFWMTRGFHPGADLTGY